MNFASSSFQADGQFRCHKIKAIQKSGGKPLNNVTEAQALLNRVHDLCRPIMIKRKWSVNLLTEFFPKDSNLLGLNVNQGEKICVRLRPANNRDAFLPYNSIVGTFLHELTHMQIAPHNAAFYALLDELWTECEAIMDNNMFQSKFKNNMFNARSGDGSSVNGNSNTTRFAGKGHRLSQNVRDKTTMKNKRQALAAAALKRARYNALVGSNTSGKKLGGNPLAGMDTCSPGSLRRRMLDAAERRRLDSISCGNKISEAAYVDDTKKHVPKSTPSVGSLGAINQKKIDTGKSGTYKTKRKRKLIETKDDRKVGQGPKHLKGFFVCHLCTFENQNSTTDICSMCNTKRRIQGLSQNIPVAPNVLTTSTTKTVIDLTGED